MSDIRKKLYEVRTEKDVSLSKLSNMTGIAKSTLQRYETGATKKIPLDAIYLIEKALNLAAGCLLGLLPNPRPKKETFASPSITPEVTQFPVLGDIGAGYDRLAMEDWTGETVEIPNTYLCGRKKEDFIVLRVKGDSMYPLYHEGDKVLILKQSTLNHSGDIGAIVYNDELVTIKKVEYAPGENWMRLISINPEYKPQQIEGEDLAHCAVIGIPKLLIREF